MRALLKKALLLGVCTTAGSLWVGLLAPEPASAFISPCNVLGSPMPPPCITFDYKRLADIATKHAQEAQKVVSKIQEVKSWADGQKIIGKMQEAVGIKDLVDTQVLNGLAQSFPDVQAATSFLSAKASTSKLFADVGASVDSMSTIQVQRDQYARAANVDSMALSYRKGEVLDAVLADANRIKKAACSSTDLRSDWAVNSEARRAVAQAQVTQNYLWQAFLQQNATRQMQLLPVALGKLGLMPSKGSNGEAAKPDNGEWDKLQRLIALNTEAQNLINRLGATKSADQVTTIVEMVKADYQDALARQANLVTAFPKKAREWACHADNCSASTKIVSKSLASLSTWDSQMQSLRTQEIAQLAGEFKERNINVDEMVKADIDPRQFIGTWGDPAKYDDITKIGKKLADNDLDEYISGDSDNAEYLQMLYDYNDVRLEVAWKKEAYEEALKTEQEVKETKVAIQKEVETELTEDAVMTRLKAIAGEGNSIGQQLASSQSPMIVDTARDRLQALNNTLSLGVKLPENTEFSPESCDAAAEYVASQGRQMTSDEITACKQAASSGSPYYVAR